MGNRNRENVVISTLQISEFLLPTLIVALSGFYVCCYLNYSHTDTWESIASLFCRASRAIREISVEISVSPSTPEVCYSSLVSTSNISLHLGRSHNRASEKKHKEGDLEGVFSYLVWSLVDRLLPVGRNHQKTDHLPSYSQDGGKIELYLHGS